MAQIRLDLDRIPTRTLEADIGSRLSGAGPEDRLFSFSSLIQRGALICLAGILPLAAAREYAAERHGGEGAEIEDDKRTGGGIPDGRSMDLSTLQDLVSGVGVILTSDFSLPRPSGVRLDGMGGGGISH